MTPSDYAYARGDDRNISEFSRDDDVIIKLNGDEYWPSKTLYLRYSYYVSSITNVEKNEL